MWYRLVLSAREVTDKHGEKTIHQTKRMYRKPIFPFNDPTAKGSSRQLGVGNQDFGPGHYTSQNPSVSKGYKDHGWIERREEKLPKGTIILHYDNLTAQEQVSIIEAANKKFGKNVDTNSEVKNLGSIGVLFDDPELIKIHPLLVEMGYDAVEHNAKDRDLGSEISNLRLLKFDSEYFTEDGQFKKRKFNRAKDKLNATNIVVINRAILTMPDLFQRVRFRPDSVTPEEMDIYKKEQSTNEIEYYENLIKNDSIKSIDIPVAISLLEKGMDPQKIKDLIFNSLSDFDQMFNFNQRLEVCKILSKYYDDRIIFKLFTPKEIEENKQIIRSVLKGVLGGETNAVGKAIQYNSTVDKLKNQLLAYYYNYNYSLCNSCNNQWQNRWKIKCDKCGSDKVSILFTEKIGLSFPQLKDALMIFDTISHFSASYPKYIYSKNGFAEQIFEKLSILPSIYNTLSELTEVKTQIVPFFDYLSSEQRKIVNDAFATQREKLNQISQSDNLNSPKFAFKIKTTFTKTAAEKHPWLNYPLSREIPKGTKRRLHYTSSDDVLLDEIKQQGLKVDKSIGHAYGDPKAIFSNPASDQLIREFQEKPLVEFYASENTIEGDQYSYSDVSPEQILGIYPSWYQKLIYLVKKQGIEGSIKYLENNKLTNDKTYSKVYEYLLKMDWLERLQVQMENGKFVFYHGTQANLMNEDGVNVLRKKSFLETTPEAAKEWGSINTRNDKRKRINVYKVLVDIFDIETGFWATTNKDLPVVKVG